MEVPTRVAVVDHAGTYQLSISNACGSVSDEVLVEFDLNEPAIPPQDQLALCDGDQILLDVTQPFEASYLWDDGSIFPVLEISTPGQYAVTVATLCLGVVHAFEAVPAENCHTGYHIPYVFSPNGDQINDLFTIRGLSIEQIAYLRIFDRWGNLVYEQPATIPNGTAGWDGTYKGKQMDPGVFVYTALLIHSNGTEESVAGV